MSGESESEQHLRLRRDERTSLRPGGFWAFMVTTESALEDMYFGSQGADGLRAQGEARSLAQASAHFFDNYPEFQAPPASRSSHRRSSRRSVVPWPRGSGRHWRERLPYRACRSTKSLWIAESRWAPMSLLGSRHLGAEIARRCGHHPRTYRSCRMATRFWPGKWSGFEIIATKPTHELIHVMLDDAHRRLKMELDKQRLVQRHAPVPQEITEPYDDSDVRRVLYRVHPVGWGEEIQLRQGLTISLEPAGHILGAASVLLEGDHRKVVVSATTRHSASAPSLPHAGRSTSKHADLLISESTYGAANHPTRESEVDRLVEAVKATIRGGGTAIIPCFALDVPRSVVHP